MRIGTGSIHVPPKVRVAGERGHDARGGDLADGGVTCVGDVDVAGAVDGHAPGGEEMRIGTGSIHVPTKVRVAGERGHDTCGGDLADGGVTCVGDVDVAGAVD